MHYDEEERKLAVIRAYLAENISQSTLVDGARVNGERTLVLKYGTTGKCVIQISQALLSDKHPTPMELESALKKRNVAGKVLRRSEYYLRDIGDDD